MMWGERTLLFKEKMRMKTEISRGLCSMFHNRQNDSHPYPPDLTSILNDAKFKASIGVPSTLNWTECNDDVEMDFEGGWVPSTCFLDSITDSIFLINSINTKIQWSGDWMLDSSKHLERVINAGVRTLYALFEYFYSLLTIEVTRLKFAYNPVSLPLRIYAGDSDFFAN